MECNLSKSGDLIAQEPLSNRIEEDFGRKIEKQKAEHEKELQELRHALTKKDYDQPPQVANVQDERFKLYEEERQRNELLLREKEEAIRKMNEMEEEARRRRMV
jgi:hypothetical protein